MNEFLLLKKVLTKHLKELKQIKGKAERALKKAPEGKLILSRSNGSTQYFWKTDSIQKKGRYLDKKSRKLAVALAQKEYDQNLLKEIEKREKKISRILELLPERGLEEAYEKLSPSRKELVIPYVLTDEQYIQQWMNVSYVGKVFSEEAPSFLTVRGEKVRSKSEKIIADKLYSMGIPYRYEYPLNLKGYGTVYPDFTLLDIASRREVYLEHLGMMDDVEYCEKALAKIQNYAKHGIFSGKSLLLTFETRYRPLRIEYLEQLLEEFFG